MSNNVAVFIIIANVWAASTKDEGKIIACVALAVASFFALAHL